MQFISIHIVNFRNFEEIKVYLENRNVFFGLNDVGKTNFLYAFRYVLDKSIRRNNLLQSDFHKKNTEETIEITIEIDIKDQEDNPTSNTDNEKIRAKCKGALTSNSDIVYIKLEALYDEKEMEANPLLFWGSNLEKLEEIKHIGNSYEIDKILNVVYIDSYVNLNSLFKKNTNKLLKYEDEENEVAIADIIDNYTKINKSISKLEGIRKFERTITSDYQNLTKEEIEITVKSEIANNDLYSNLVPYIKKNNDDNIYPTSGEGRRKLLSYSIYKILSKQEEERKINIYLIEEPENNLHRSMQIALSKTLFESSEYKYMFITTHSPFILYEMENVNLVRIYNDTKVNSASFFYRVSDEFKKKKYMLNRNLSEAIFANKVLLVEGPSELVLFRKILSIENPLYEVNDSYILDIGGIGFFGYCKILKALKIHIIIKTDNDLRSISKSSNYSVLGFCRVNRLIGTPSKPLPVAAIEINSLDSKRQLYKENIEILDKIRKNNHIYLSQVDLENDLDEIMHDKLITYINDKPVEYLQNAKRNNMVELTEKITQDDCTLIYNSYNFECLKEL